MSRRAEVAANMLADGEAPYRQLVELSPDGMLIRSEGNIVFANRACAKLLGVDSPEQLIGRAVLDFVPPEYHEAVRARMRDVHERGQPLPVEEKRIRLDGTVVDVEVTASPFMHQGKRAAQIILRDITRRKEAQEKIRETEAFLSVLAAIVEHANDAIISRTLDGTILSWNAGAERMFGYAASEAIGRSVTLIVPPSEPRPRHNIQHVLRGERVPARETQCLTKNGELVDVLISHSPLKDGEGNIVGASVILQDISALKRAERAAKESEGRFHAAFDQAGVGMALENIDPREPRWLRVNQKLCDILGYTERELLEVDPPALIVPEDGSVAQDYTERPGQSNIPSDAREQRYMRKDGQIVWLNVTRSLVTGADGRPGCIIAVLQDITDKKKTTEQLAYLAQYDSLTGLPNRSLFRDRLRQAIARAQRNEKLLALIFLDLDHFKEINDTLGHTVGDQVLCAVAARLTEARRETDTIARLGGDEFTVILENISDSDQATTLAQKIQDTFSKPFLIAGQEIFVTASIGITVSPRVEDDIDVLLQSTDIAMYRAKEEGRNTYAFYDAAMNAHAAESLRIENLLRRALERDEFVLHYQPRISVRTGRIVGVEALLRWNSRELGLVCPERFIPLAEKTGLILSIGEWVLKNACAQNKRWQDAGHPPIVVSVNLSQRQFRQKNLIETVVAALEETGLDARCLELELTESMIMADSDRTIAVLHELHGLGVQLSIDDFGTGYSSLAYLKRFPVQKLKIDQSFIQDIADSDKNGIVTAVIVMAKSLGLGVVAEGVESRRQLAWLAQFSCDEYQGYYFSRPVPAQELATLLERTRRIADRDVV